MSKITAKTVQLSALVDDPEVNVRRSNQTASLEELQASIKAHGIQQSLRVRPADEKGMYRIIAGHRRFAALCALRDAGEINDGYEVPVLVGKATDAEARELSTVENVERLALTVVDEFRAFKAMTDDGAGSAEIAARFGLPERRVQQRLKLAALHPAVVEALEADKITLDAARAFTLQPDPELQREYLEKAAGYWELEANTVRRNMTQADLSARSSLAKLLTEEAYVAAGGVVNRDLFGEDSTWTSPAIVAELVEQHWKAQVEKWTAEGWAFVSPDSEYGNAIYSMRKLHAARPEPQYSKKDAKRLEKIEAELSAYEDADELTDEQDEATSALETERMEIEARYETEPAYTAEQKARSGVVYAEDGRTVWYGVIDPAKVEITAEDADMLGIAQPKKPAAKDDDPLALTATMKTALTVTMTHALQDAVKGNPDMALVILVATLHARMRTWGKTPSHLSGGYSIDRADQTPPQGKDFGEALAWAREQSREALLAYLGELVAQSIDVRDTNQDNPRGEGVDALIAYVAPDVLPIFDPGAYFAGVKKPVIVAAYKEMTGTTLRDGKKADMAVAATDSATATGWLPVELRTAAYVGPGSASATSEEIGEAA